RLALDSPGQASTGSIEAHDSQEPVVSRDGQLLAFLRPVRGRNSLWVQSIVAAGGVPESGGAHEIVGEDYDVHEATFLPDHRIIFSSKKNGRFAFYVATQSGDTAEVRKPRC